MFARLSPRFPAWFAMIAAAAWLGFAPAATAQDAVVITARCVDAIQSTGNETRESVRAAAARGVRALAVLDANEATDEQLIAAADAAKSAVQRRATAGAGRIDRLADHCVAVLEGLEADQRLIDRVEAARTNQKRSIGTVATNAHEAVNAALEFALNN